MQKRSMEEMNRLSVDEFRQAEKFPFVIVLENIRSLNNVGSFFRTADAFRAETIYLGGYTPSPPHREITKSALGAERAVAWQKVNDTLELVRNLREEGYILVAVEQTLDSVPLHKFRPKYAAKYAFVFGNEVEGVSEELLAVTDMCVEIPQFGTKHSFNVSVSAGIVLWKFVEENLT
ncbi:RNA methyltransferase [Salmonirosea aquatica]|uniref:TrmH family RNA methyltransferase n=1 Tax=Salmonirosea aquatica TaxID=2654236 RepID=A0A7C9BA93_9BACT|nr:TrmH family RNA methyltransferase [Cytophagaceae bacterium SJW1-29]